MRQDNIEAPIDRVGQMQDGMFMFDKNLLACLSSDIDILASVKTCLLVSRYIGLKMDHDAH